MEMPLAAVRPGGILNHDPREAAKSLDRALELNGMIPISPRLRLLLMRDGAFFARTTAFAGMVHGAGPSTLRRPGAP